jgi:hypothetical protein
MVANRGLAMAVDPDQRNVEQKVDTFVYDTFSKGDKLFKELISRYGGQNNGILSSPINEGRSLGPDSIANPSNKTPMTGFNSRSLAKENTEKPMQISAFGRDKVGPQKTILQKTQTYKPGQSSIQPRDLRKNSDIAGAEVVKKVDDFDFDGESNM